MQDFRKLDIYQKSIDYCVRIYHFSASLPESEKYGLISQIRRAAASVPLNISEGAGTNTKREFAQFIGYAYRSVNEVMTCLVLVRRLNLYKKSTSDIDVLHDEGVGLSRMTYAFLKKLNG